MRRYSLDELPQLLNILCGEMSLVGPRPLQLRDSDKLLALDPTAYARRLDVMPGLTGPWQIGGRSELNYEQMVELDVHYVENWSNALDLKIIAKTFFVVLLPTRALADRSVRPWFAEPATYEKRVAREISVREVFGVMSISTLILR